MIIGVLNQKGGVGKTTLAVNLAATLASQSELLYLMTPWRGRPILGCEAPRPPAPFCIESDSILHHVVSRAASPTIRGAKSNHSPGRERLQADLRSLCDYRGATDNVAHSAPAHASPRL